MRSRQHSATENECGVHGSATCSCSALAWMLWGALNAKARHWLKRRIKNRCTDTALITKLVDIALDRVQQHLKSSGLGHFNKAMLLELTFEYLGLELDG